MKSGEQWWQAVCYVLDELPPSERAAFERRLAESQELREAVVEASKLIDIIKASRSRPADAKAFPTVTLPTTCRATLAGTFAVLWTVVLLAFLSFWAVRLNHQPSVDPALAQVASLWADLAVAEPSGGHSPESDWIDADIVVEIADETDVPEWLVAGVEETQCQ